MTVHEIAKTHPHWDAFNDTEGWLAHVAAVEAEIDHLHAARQNDARKRSRAATYA